MQLDDRFHSPRMTGRKSSDRWGMEQKGPNAGTE